MATLQIPAMYSPFSSALHPCSQQVQQESVTRWAHWMGFEPMDKGYQALQAGQFGLLMGRCHPTASLETLSLLTDFTTWLFLWDDLVNQVDESGMSWRPEQLQAMNDRAQRLLLGNAPQAQDGPLVRGLWHLLEGLKARMSGQWMHRFTFHLQEYFEATVWQATSLRRGAPPDVDTYTRMRRLTSGMFVMVDLIEVAGGMEVPLQARLEPLLAAMVRCTVNAVAWANDIFSLGKELLHGDRHNLVLVLQNKWGLTLEEALREAAVRHDAEVRHFIDCQHALPSFGAEVDEAVGRYVEGLRCWMRAKLDWSAMNGRYRQGTELSAQVRAVPHQPECTGSARARRAPPRAAGTSKAGVA
ncbi:terpene synthase family protein [Archangium sp.]|uniref:terpene synthase family protein n=1 Tax=Archangium sp. TaxID=1872627 RepID=UPI002D3C6AD7|nr:hypothetical protein [Archangium sp.]HYO59587.1 hypothetical protein [Archangium sp.]